MKNVREKFQPQKQVQKRFREVRLNAVESKARIKVEK